MKHSLLQDGKHYQLYRRILYLMVAVFLLMPAGKNWASSLIYIKVLENIEIDDDNIILGKIAKIEGNDSVLIENLRQIIIANAPLPGKSRKLEGDLFKLRLKQNSVDLNRLDLRIPPKVIVTRRFIEVSREEIQALVSNYLLEHMPAVGGDVRIKEVQVAEALKLPTGRVTYKLNPPRNLKMLGKIPISIHFDVNGNYQKRVWATATVEVLAEVVVTKRPLGRHKPLTEDDFELQRMDLSNVPANVITEPEAILGKRTRRAIGAKTILRADLIEFPPLVKRGDLVMIIAESDGFKITALGQVKKRGRLGERIPVINFDSKKILYARVVDANTVKVDY